MGYESIFQFGREKVEKQRGFRNFGLAFGILSIVITLLSLVALIVLPFFVETAGLIDLIRAIIGATDWIDIVAYAVSLFIIVVAVISCIASGVKMVKKTVEKSGNVSFDKIGLLALAVFSILGEVVAEILPFTIFRFAILGVLLLNVIYSFGITVNNDRYFSKVNTKLTGPVVISLISIAVAMVAVLIVFPIADLFAAPRILGGLLGGIADASNLNSYLDIVRAPLYFTLCGMLIAATFSFILNLFKFSFDKNYIRGSSYFSNSSPAHIALPLIVNALAVYILVDVANGRITSFADFFAFPRLYLVIALLVVLVLTIIYSVLIAKDKRKVVYGIDANALPENIVEEESPILLPLAEEVAEEPVEEVVEEVIEEPVEEIEEIEEVVEEEIVEEPIIVEEPVVEVKKEEPAPVAEPVQPAPAPVNAYAYPQQPVAPYGYPQAPYGYAQAPYAPYPYPPMPYYMPYPVIQQTPAPAPAPAQQPTIICIPYGAPAPAPAQTPAQTPAPAPVVEAVKPAPVVVEEVEEVVEPEENTSFEIVKLTLEEKIAALPAQMKKYYKQISSYAAAKDGVKVNKATYAESVFFGRDCVVKIQIKQGKIVCSFSLVNFEVKSMLKSGKAREQLTVVKVVDANSLALAKQSVDMAYKLAVEAKEERHREQLRKRREARQAKK